MKRIIYITILNFILFPLAINADDTFSVEIEALTLVMEEYKKNQIEEDIDNQNPSFMAFKQDECNAKVEVSEKNGLQITTKELFDVNVCKKEINRILIN